MRPAEDIKRLIKNSGVKISSDMDKRILGNALEELEKLKHTKPLGPRPGVWRKIMNSKLTRLATAAGVIIVVSLLLRNGSVDLATPAFADITEAMKKVPWMHQESRGFERGITGLGEQWFGFEAKVFAGKDSTGKIYFWNIKEHKRYEYDPKSQTVTIDYAYEKDFPLNLSSPVSLIESMHKMLKEQGAEVVTKEGQYEGQKAHIQEVTLTPEGLNNETHTLQLYIQPESKLLLAARVKGTDANGNTIMDGEIAFSYPKTGPTNIYDLGVPHDAEIISNLPEEDYQAIWNDYRQSREDVTRQYIAVITHADSSLARTSPSLKGIINMVDVDYKSDRNHRLERHFVFNPGQQFDKFWPTYKEQLGDSFESLLAWTNAHYDNAGHISIYLYDGEYDISTRRDDQGAWNKLRKSYSPDSESMPNIKLEDLVWPNIGKTGRIIDDDYSRENNLICIERLQQGDIYPSGVSLPARFLFYLDVEKDYMCLRKVTEQRPDAEWQENKNWLEGIEPEKIRDGSITVHDITEVIQADNGYWYPKVIEVKQTSIRKDYKQAPLKTSSIKRIYIQTNPQFPAGIFDPDNIIPKNHQVVPSLSGQAFAIIDGSPDWPEPKELVEAYWQARAKKDYEKMTVYWPDSAAWDRQFLADEEPVEYVFGEAVKPSQGLIVVPYASKDYYEQHGEYNLKMMLQNKRSAKGRYYIMSGN